jgi:hypothetical protein
MDLNGMGFIPFVSGANTNKNFHGETAEAAVRGDEALQLYTTRLYSVRLNAVRSNREI